MTEPRRLHGIYATPDPLAGRPYRTSNTHGSAPVWGSKPVK